MQIFSHSICLLILLNGCAQAQTPNNDHAIALTAKSTKTSIPMRMNLLGHNIPAIDWHGQIQKRQPFFWDESRQTITQKSHELVSKFPLHLLRFHAENHYAWKQMVGPVDQRTPIEHHFDHSFYRTNPGFADYLSWASSLRNRPELSMIASPLRPIIELAELVAYCNQTSSPMAQLRAKHGHPKPYFVKHWEMGNELDWRGRTGRDITDQNKYQKTLGRITVDRYIELLKPRIATMKQVDPDILIYAHAKSAPFFSQNPNWPNWHRKIIKQLGDQIDGIIIHPYYDGYTVTTCMQSIDALASDIAASQSPHLKIWVNEHARWVNFKTKRPWSDSWNLQGAISTTDFLIHLIQRPQVAAANYWALAHQGPWRMIQRQNKKGQITYRYTPVHAAYDLMNQVVLPVAKPLILEQKNLGNHPRGYDYSVHAISFSDLKNHKQSLLAVNRSSNQTFTIKLDCMDTIAPTTIKQFIVTGPQLDADNTPQTPNAIQCRLTNIQPCIQNQQLQFTLPPRAIAGWVWTHSQAGHTP